MKGKKEKAVEAQLLANYKKYYRMVFTYVRNETDALDVVQEGAYKAMYRADQLRELAYADTWICRIMLNEAKEFLRRNKSEYEDIFETEIGKDEVYEDIDLRRAIDGLAPKEKTIVILRYFEDMSLEQVADVMQENLSTVKSRLYRTLDKLKVKLSE